VAGTAEVVKSLSLDLAQKIVAQLEDIRSGRRNISADAIYLAMCAHRTLPGRRVT
jgi:hypothetical protein